MYKIYILIVVSLFCGQSSSNDFEYMAEQRKECYAPRYFYKCPRLEGIKLTPSSCSGSFCKYKFLFDIGKSLNEDTGYLLHKKLWEYENIIFISNSDFILEIRRKNDIHTNFIESVRGKIIDRVSGNLYYNYYSEGEYLKNVVKFKNASVVKITSITLKKSQECECIIKDE